MNRVSELKESRTSRSKKLSVKSLLTIRKLKNYLIHDLEIFKVLFVVGYVLLGGFLFAGEEYTSRAHNKVEISMAETQLVESIKALLDKRPPKNVLVDLVHQRTLYYVENYELLGEKEYDVVWSLSISIYNVFVMITTIGYGDFIPATDRGKLLTILYSGIGIAMCLSTFIKFGNVIVITIYNFCRLARYLFRKKIDKKPTNAPWKARRLKDVSLPFVLTLNIIYITIGASLLQYWSSQLGFLNAAYFLVITMSTVGFGDIYPDKHTMFFCVGLTCLGLGLMASLFTKIRRWTQQNLEVKLIKYLTLKRRKYKRKVVPARVLSRLASTLELPESVYRQISLSSEASYKTKGGSVVSWSDYGEQAYVVDFERCLVM